MGQLGFFDLNRRYESLTEKNDPLVAIAAMVPFESFRPKLHTALIKGERCRSEAGSRKTKPAKTTKTRTRAGQRSMTARISVTRTISASTAGTNSCAVT